MSQAGNNWEIRNNIIIDTGVYGIFPQLGQNGVVEHNIISGIEDVAIGGVAGFNYLLTDHVTIDMGAFYEYALTTADASVAFDNLGGATADIAIRPQGLIVFMGLSYAF